MFKEEEEHSNLLCDWLSVCSATEQQHNEVEEEEEEEEEEKIICVGSLTGEMDSTLFSVHRYEQPVAGNREEVNTKVNISMVTST